MTEPLFWFQIKVFETPLLSSLWANLQPIKGLLWKALYPFIARSKFHMVLPQSTDWEHCAKIWINISAAWHWRYSMSLMHTVGNSCLNNCEWITEAMKMPTSCCYPCVFFKFSSSNDLWSMGIIRAWRSGHPNIVTEHMGISSEATVECQEIAP